MTAPLTILIAALGGQGGGVLTDWIVQAARLSGRYAQATSTPGVSQRTGATTYYVEIAERGDRGAPTLALMPLPGRVDVLVAAELLEAARMLERGMITPSRTTVIASTHRVYTTREKMSAGDGRFDAAAVIEALRTLSRRSVLVDMEALRAAHRAAISAVLFGALAGSGVLPLPRAACEEAIRAAGKGTVASLAAFAAAYERARLDDPPPERPPTRGSGLPVALAARVTRLPPRVADIALEGAARTLEWQDDAYAQHYLDRVEALVRAESSVSFDVTREAARWLALWMSYRDAIDVARVKGSHARLAQIRRDSGAGPQDVVRVYEFFSPGSAEIAAILPQRLGAWLERRAAGKRTQSPRRGVRLETTSLSGALGLALLGALKPLRRSSLRFAREQDAIDEWLAAVVRAFEIDPALGLEVARLPQLVKGYGEIHDRGRDRFAKALAAFRQACDSAPEALAKALAALRAAALAEPDGDGVSLALGCANAAAKPQPVQFVPPRDAQLRSSLKPTSQ